MLPMLVHYKNKYPGARVEASEESLTVTKDGELLLSLKRGGGGALVDNGPTVGARDLHDMSPIPKNTRVYKLTTQDRIALDEKHEERREVAQHLAGKYGKVPCISSLKKEGWEFDGETVLPKNEARPVENKLDSVDKQDQA